jgi:hypothetical protein
MQKLTSQIEVESHTSQTPSKIVCERGKQAHKYSLLPHLFCPIQCLPGSENESCFSVVHSVVFGFLVKNGNCIQKYRTEKITLLITIGQAGISMFIPSYSHLKQGRILFLATIAVRLVLRDFRMRALLLWQRIISDCWQRIRARILKWLSTNLTAKVAKNNILPCFDESTK